MARNVGQDGADDERERDERVGDRDEHPRPAQIDRTSVHVMSRPKPRVTADVPSGSISPASNSTPARRE